MVIIFIKVVSGIFPTHTAMNDNKGNKTKEKVSLTCSIEKNFGYQFITEVLQNDIFSID